MKEIYEIGHIEKYRIRIIDNGKSDRLLDIREYKLSENPVEKTFTEKGIVIPEVYLISFLNCLQYAKRFLDLTLDK